jgi:hypothetical protein
VSLSPRDAAFLLTCLRFLGAEAPCQARIEAVIGTVAGTETWQGCRIPSTVFGRGLCMAAVIWAIDSGLVGIGERDVAQRILETLWQAGPIRPALIGAQIECLVGQDDGDRQCRWTCPAMRRANAGFALMAGSIGRPALPDLVWTVVEASSTATAVERAPVPTPPVPRWPPRRGARIRCQGCGRLGTVLGVDTDDGWTVIEHHAPVLQRPDGLWEVQHLADNGPRQCRYLSHVVDARVV